MTTPKPDYVGFIERLSNIEFRFILYFYFVILSFILRNKSYALVHAFFV